MTELNIADDYFKAVEWGGEWSVRRTIWRRGLQLKAWKLVSTQMKLEAVLKDLEERQRSGSSEPPDRQLEGELRRRPGKTVKALKEP